MILNNQTITIFGGTGFVGRYIIRVLAKTGARINVLSRSPNEYSFLKTAGSLGQISFFQGSIKDHDLIEELIAKSDVVINAVGILFEKKGQSFIEVHSDFPEFIAKMAYKYQIKKLLHISALGIDEAINSKYAASKFGEEDQFFNKFAQLTSFSPFLPLIEQGKTRFQPVYVADVSRAIYNIMVYEGYDNKTYELGGPDIYSFKEIYEYILKVLGRKRFLIKLPNFVAKIMALIFELMPTPMLTIDQLKLLKTDNITKKKVNSFFHLQIQPYKIEEIVPKYLQMYKSDCYHRKDNNN
jgi:uncharacterized protein YbjT (DUF2867 family)